MKVAKFTPTLQRVAFSNGQNELTLDAFSYPSDGSSTNYPNAKVEIRVEPSGTFAVGWQSWSVAQNSYVAKFQSFAASGNSLTAVLGNHLGTFVSLDFAQMDVGSYVFTATNAGSTQAWVSEFFSK